MENTPLPPNRP